ncbi:hypothetical protein IU449_03520 [Nocardia higoensis]|uniref:Transcriptional regulator n=1 Tax=Nocardia higoensis TaxID=228599 RepID=A0ABS0D7J6_9NOCA|nr:hypothetical protein [Nocardia higoensis]MBF6353627.1 hypothetical protein [Nocardia higoensis]
MRRRQLLAAIAAALAGADVDLRAWWPDPQSGAWGPPPARVGHLDVVRLGHVTRHLRALDAETGGGAALDPAVAALEHSSRLLERADTKVRAELLAALADMANVVGWAAHDAGHHELAAAHLMRALDWALAADSAHGSALAANILFHLARVALYREDPDTALGLVRHGHGLTARTGNTAESAQLHATAAWAHALKGDHRQVAESLARAEDDIHASSAPEAPWMRIFFAPGDFAGHQALVYSALASHTTDARTAESVATTALERTRVSLPQATRDRPSRSLTFDAIVAAQNAFRLGDLDSAIPMTKQALSGAAATTSRRATERLQEIALAAAPHTHHGTVADLHHDLVLAGA